MNATEIVSPANPGLNRIRKVIWMIRILIGLAVVFIVAFHLLFLSSLIGWTDLSPRSTTFPPLSRYASVHAIPASVLILGFVRTGLFFAGAFVLNRLLRSFARGNLFTARNINGIRWLGGLVIGDWVVVKFLEAFASRSVAVGFDDFAKLAIGFLVVLIAWIMDEGRKIQEEQELTV